MMSKEKRIYNIGTLREAANFLSDKFRPLLYILSKEIVLTLLTLIIIKRQGLF